MFKTKEEARAYNREYYWGNRDIILRRKRGQSSQYNPDYHRRYYQKNKERIRERNKKSKEHILQRNRDWRLKIKTEALTYYGGSNPVCTKCGFSDIRALSIDHIQGGGTHRRSLIGKRLALWLKQQGYPEGYQTLCMNCQFIKRVENKEYGNT